MWYSRLVVYKGRWREPSRTLETTSCHADGSQPQFRRFFCADMPREFDNGRRRARLPVKRCSLPSNRPSRREAASRSASQLASRGSDSWLLVGRRLVRERGGELLAPRSLHSRRHLAQPGVGSAAVQPHAARTRRLRSVHPAGPGGSRSNPASQQGLEADGLMPTAFGKQLKAALADAGRAEPPTRAAQYRRRCRSSATTPAGFPDHVGRPIDRYSTI